MGFRGATLLVQVSTQPLVAVIKLSGMQDPGDV